MHHVLRGECLDTTFETIIKCTLATTTSKYLCLDYQIIRSYNIIIIISWSCRVILLLMTYQDVSRYQELLEESLQLVHEAHWHHIYARDPQTDIHGYWGNVSAVAEHRHVQPTNTRAMSEYMWRGHSSSSLPWWRVRLVQMRSGLFGTCQSYCQKWYKIEGKEREKNKQEFMLTLLCIVGANGWWQGEMHRIYCTPMWMSQMWRTWESLDMWPKSWSPSKHSSAEKVKGQLISSLYSIPANPYRDPWDAYHDRQ